MCPDRYTRGGLEEPELGPSGISKYVFKPQPLNFLAENENAKRSNAGIVTVRAGRAQILLQARVSNDNTYTEYLFRTAK